MNNTYSWGILVSIIGSRGKNILSKPFIAILLLTILFSLTVFLPRIMSPLLGNKHGRLFVGGGLSIDYKLINSTLLEVNITNNYNVGVIIDQIIFCNKTFHLGSSLEPHNMVTYRFMVIETPHGKNYCLLIIKYRVRGYSRQTYRVIMLR
jgi:hypothetical protein